MNDGGYMAVSPHSSNIVVGTGNVYNAGYFLGITLTSDGGATWGHDTLASATRGWAVAFDPIDQNRVYVGGDSAYSYPALFITTDLGASWTMSRTGLSGTVNALATVPGNGQLVYAGTNNGVFISTDAGATWSVSALTRTVRALVIDPGNTDNVYAGTYGYGVYFSTDAGATWTAMNTGLTCNNVLSLDVRGGSEITLFAGTEGGSVFRTTLASGIAGPRGAVRSSQFALSVSPNPCHATAFIQFSTPRTASTRLTLYDASGRFVRELALQSSSVTLRTAGLTPGAYFVRLSDGVETRTARLTVLE
jgi:hypothetical protein